MTKQQAIENHRKMWNWIADETLRQKRRMKKREYFEAMGIPVDERPISECYCCEYANVDCSSCLVIWPNSFDCLAEFSLYNLWCCASCGAKDYKEAAKYARMIAELPERK